MQDLTTLLHRAFAGLGRMGLPCACVDQSPQTTARRARLGECFVAVCDGRIVGTLTLHRPQPRSDCPWYRRQQVASVHQFAVDPAHQGSGCGTALLRFATRWARDRGFQELALDTPAPATHLVQFYQAQGFRLVEQVQFPARPYRSALLSKSIVRHSAALARPEACASARHIPLFGTMV